MDTRSVRNVSTRVDMPLTERKINTNKNFESDEYVSQFKKRTGNVAEDRNKDDSLNLQEWYNRLVTSSPSWEGREFFERGILANCTKQNLMGMYNLDSDGMDLLMKYWYGENWTFDKIFDYFHEKGTVAVRNMFNELAASGNSAAVNIVSRDRKIGDGSDVVATDKQVVVTIGGIAKD